MLDNPKRQGAAGLVDPKFLAVYPVPATDHSARQKKQNSTGKSTPVWRRGV
jgi:hypothetical protein